MKKINYWLCDEGLLMIAAWRRDGFSTAEIAKKMGVSKHTLTRWQKSYPKIFEAMRFDRDQTDARVENAILKKALGFVSSEEKRVVKSNGTEEVTTVIKEIPPDVSAASVWLKNRRPDKWSDKPKSDENATYKKLDEVLGGIDAQADR